MEDLSAGDFKKIVEKLVSDTCCPVCFNPLHSPVRLCRSGHGVCGDCQAKLNKCPLCTLPFSSKTSKNVLLNSMLDILRHQCKYDGCNAFVQLEDKHEKWCGYQPTSCHVEKCKWIGCGNEIHYHIIQVHKGTLMNEKAVDWVYPKPNLSLRCFVPIFAHGHFFWMHRRSIKDKTIKVDFIYVPNGKIKRSFKIELLFGDYKQYQSSSILVTPENVMNEDEMSMEFVFSSLQRLINSEGDLTFEFTMSKY